MRRGYEGLNSSQRQKKPSLISLNFYHHLNSKVAVRGAVKLAQTAVKLIKNNYAISAYKNYAKIANFLLKKWKAARPVLFYYATSAKKSLT